MLVKVSSNSCGIDWYIVLFLFFFFDRTTHLFVLEEWKSMLSSKEFHKLYDDPLPFKSNYYVIEQY